MKQGSTERSLSMTCQYLQSNVVVRSIVSVEMGDEDSCNNKDTRVARLVTIEAPENCLEQTETSPSKRRAELSDHIKCTYTNTCSTGNEQQELKAVVQ